MRLKGLCLKLQPNERTGCAIDLAHVEAERSSSVAAGHFSRDSTKDLRRVMESLGEWNAYVTAGADREDRKARLAECPESLRENVTCHVKTVFELRRRSRQCQRNSKSNFPGRTRP